MAETANIQAETSSEEHTAEYAELSSSSGKTAVLRERYLIDGGEPLSHLDSASALAYMAYDRLDNDAKLFALICQPDMPVRLKMLAKLRGRHINGMIPLVDFGSIDWPISGKFVIAIVFERPMGGRLTDALATQRTHINDENVIERILNPAVKCIMALSESKLTHRAIRPNNLFFMTEDCQDVVLGDCFSSPCGFDQPAVFETIPRSTASPAGRGIGSAKDDLYALAVTIVFTLFKSNPVQNTDELTLLSMKIERGSYATVCGNSRMHPTIVEVLRGLLIDDEVSRWTPQMVIEWMQQGKRAPILSHRQQIAKMPYMFQGHAHKGPITLAYEFSKNIDEVIQTLKSDKAFDVWLRRNLENNELADMLEGPIKQASLIEESNKIGAEVLVSRICMILDPKGPIRFMGLALMPDALGPNLAFEILIQKNIGPLVNMINLELYETWFKLQQTEKEDALFLLKGRFTECRKYLKIEGPGYGIERCLYECNPDLPCQSPLIKNEFVTVIEDLLPAIDKAASKADTNASPIDRHIAAFIASRFNDDNAPQIHQSNPDKNLVRSHLKEIASSEESKRVIALLSLLSQLQKVFETPPLLGLASWIGGLLGPVINTYRSRSTRRKLEKEAPQLVRKGSLPELFNLVENAQQRELDVIGFSKAEREYIEIENEIINIEGEGDEREIRTLELGQKATAMITILLAMTIVSIIFLLDNW